MKENDIEIKRGKVSVSTLPSLIDKILDSVIIYNNDEQSEFAIAQTKFDKERLSEFIDVNKVKEILEEKCGDCKFLGRITATIPHIKIPFIHQTRSFFEKTSVIKYIDMRINGPTVEINKPGMVEGEDTTVSKRLITITDVIENLKNELPEVMANSKYNSATGFIRKFEHVWKPTIYKKCRANYVEEDEVERLKDIIIDQITIVNINKKDDTLGFSKYNISREKLNFEFIRNNYVGKDYFESVINYSVSLDDFSKRMQRNIPHIKIPLSKEKNYFRKEAIDFIKHLQNEGISFTDTVSTINEELGTNFGREMIRNAIVKNGITLYCGVPGFTKGNANVILKEDIPKLIEILEDKKRYGNCSNLYSYMETYIENEVEFVNSDASETMALFDQYILEFSNDTKITKDADIKRLFRQFSQVYDFMNKNLNKELWLYDDEEVLELFECITGIKTKYVVTAFKTFFNYVMTKMNQRNRRLFSPTGQGKKVLPYKLENYFAVLGNIAKYLDNKDNVLNNLVDALSARSKTSALLYVLTHYTACWRASDIQDQLPNPNLKLIGFDSGEEFIEWFKKDGSIFTEEMGRLICTDIENKIKVTRASASKNDGKLLIYVSKFLYKTYGLLLCICEVHRQRRATIKKSEGQCLLTKESSKKISKQIDNLSVEILKPIGLFSNRRANKSFETYICEKSEEWNMGVGYLMAAVARGHKLDKRLLSETTKIYVNKNVDSMSFMVFSSEVFSGVKYEFLSVIDEEFDNKTLEEKSIQATELGISNYDLEVMLETVGKKQFAIDKFFRENLSTKQAKKKTLSQLMFGNNCHSKHENAKCLLRAYESSKNTDDEIDLSKGFLKPCIYIGSKSCVGCPYLVAEKYFLYELQSKLISALNSLESARSEFDKMIHLNRIKDIFFPIVFEAMNEFGKEYVKSIIEVDKMTTIYKQEKQLLESK